MHRFSMRCRFRAYTDGTLHPWRHVTGALGGGAVAGFRKRIASRRRFEYLARRYPQAEWSTMNYGYACSPGGDAPGGRLAVGSRAVRPSALLARGDIGLPTPRRSGRARNRQWPWRRRGIHRPEPQPASPAGAGLLGRGLFADFVSRRNGALARLEQELRSGPLHLLAWDDISANVARALDLDETRKRDLIDRWATRPFRSFARGAYAMEGTAMRREFRAGQTVYVATVLGKAIP